MLFCSTAPPHHSLRARTLCPPSEPSLLLVLNFTCPTPNFLSSPCSFTSRTAEGANSKLSPTSRLIMSSKSAAALCCFLSPTLPPALSTADVVAVTRSEASARCSLNVAIQSGEVKRCTNVIEHGSSNLGEMVGTWVAMTTRQALCLCSLITVRRFSVNVSAAGMFFITCELRQGRLVSLIEDARTEIC